MFFLITVHSWSDIPELCHADSTWEVWGAEGELKLNLVAVILQRAAGVKLARQHLLSKALVIKAQKGVKEIKHLTTIRLGLSDAAAMNPKQRLLLARLTHVLFWIFSNCLSNFTNLESPLGSGVSGCVVLRELDPKELWQRTKGIVLQIRHHMISFGNYVCTFFATSSTLTVYFCPTFRSRPATPSWIFLEYFYKLLIIRTICTSRCLTGFPAES